MWIATKTLCAIVGITRAEFDVMRRVTKIDLKFLRRWNGSAGKSGYEWDVSMVVAWLDGLLPGGVTSEQQKAIMAEAVL